jgi:3-oxoacyl-[acyl-carrier-protein] synthase II
MNNDNHRVVVTGIGVISPLGLDVDSTWEGLVAGRSGIDYITLFDPSGMEVKFAGEAKGFDPTNYVDRKAARRMDRFAQFAVAASMQAIQQSGIKIDNTNQEDIGILRSSKKPRCCWKKGLVGSALF